MVLWVSGPLIIPIEPKKYSEERGSFFIPITSKDRQHSLINNNLDFIKMFDSNIFKIVIPGEGLITRYNIWSERCFYIETQISLQKIS